MNTQPTWNDMTAQEKNAALAEMIRYWDNHWCFDFEREEELPDFIHNYTACFVGPVAWAKEQGLEVIIYCGGRNGSQVNVWPKDDNQPGTCVSGDSPDAICQAIWEAANKSAEKQ